MNNNSGRHLFLALIANCLLASSAFAKSSIMLPHGRNLLRVSDDGSTKSIPFGFAPYLVNAGPLPKVSPDKSKIAFTSGPNVWILNSTTLECTQITDHGEWDFKSSWGEFINIYGWSKDGKSLLVEAHSGEYGPGEGEALPEITPLKRCSRVITPKPLAVSKGDGRFLLDVDARKFSPTAQDAPVDVYPDGAYEGAAKSPDGKQDAFIREPYGGKSELVVGSQPVLPDVKVRQFWWISNKAVAALSWNDSKKGFDIYVVSLPKKKVHGPYFEPQK